MDRNNRIKAITQSLNLMIQSFVLNMFTKLKILAVIVLEKIMTQVFLEEKKHEKD